jgi:hypothetical protein
MTTGCWLAAFVLAAAASISTAMAERVEVRFLPSEEPAFYLQFDKDEMRVAVTPEGLAEAAPVKAVGDPQPLEDEGKLLGTSYSFPPAALPVTLPGVVSATGSFAINRLNAAGEQAGMRDVWPLASGDVSLILRDAGGAAWSYSVGADFPESHGGERPSPTDLPALRVLYDLAGLTPKVEAQVKGDEVRIGVRMWGLDRDDRALGRRFGFIPVVHDLQREGKPAPVHLEVTDAAGEVAIAKDGDLHVFGFG